MVAAGTGPLLAIKYFRYKYKPSIIHVLQQMERSHCEPFTVTNIEPQPYQPLLYDLQVATESTGLSSFDPHTKLQR